jgi:hemerythrin-like domain-containing protein
MKPIGPLMREHRLIEHMVRLMRKELDRIKKGKGIAPDFIENAVDFFRTYADRTHHGKEEDILFRDLAKKQLSPELKRTMDELTAEHVLSRETVTSLVSAKERYIRGDSNSISQILDSMQFLVALYPMHIGKEDKRFFHPCMEYFGRREQNRMLKEFWEFDRSMIHEKYQKVVEVLGEKVS